MGSLLSASGRIALPDMPNIIIALIIINTLAFGLMGLDKLLAIFYLRRIPEKWLLGLALVFGAAGTWLGMWVWRHKTCHRQFSFGVPLLLGLQILLLWKLPDLAKMLSGEW